MTDFKKLELNYAKDLSNLSLMVAWAADQQLHGSFSARRPDLGKMFNCPFCGTRRRLSAPRCCNPAYATKKKGVECSERVNENMFSKPFLRKLRHKRHGQSRQFKIRQLTYNFQNNPTLLKAAADHIQVKLPEAAAIPAFAEKYFYWRREQQDKIYRKQASRARRRNR